MYIVNGNITVCFGCAHRSGMKPLGADATSSITPVQSELMSLVEDAHDLGRKFAARKMLRCPCGHSKQMSWGNVRDFVQHVDNTCDVALVERIRHAPSSKEAVKMLPCMSPPPKTPQRRSRVRPRLSFGVVPTVEEISDMMEWREPMAAPLT